MTGPGDNIGTERLRSLIERIYGNPLSRDAERRLGLSKAKQRQPRPTRYIKGVTYPRVLHR